MYKYIYKSALLLSLIAFATVSYSAGIIQMNGSIVEDTCSQQQNNTDCQQLNLINTKLETQTLAANDLNLQTQKNLTTEISIERLPDQKNAIIIASYY